MLQFINPAFMGDQENEGELEEGSAMDSFADFRNMEELLDELMIKKTEEKLDLSTLNRKRLKLNDSGDNLSALTKEVVKMASLEAPRDGSAIDDQYSHDKELLLKNMETVLNDNSVEETSKHLLNYFALIGHPANKDDFDYLYVESLAHKADFNSMDVHRQTLMHEVSREWNTDVAYFLKTKGVHVDVEDLWGRTPLFVAVASNNIDMVKWLIENEADISHRTVKGERQCAIHYAARYDSVEAFDILVLAGADPLSRDEHDRTPFFLAAELGNSRICSHFLDMELPTVSYASHGVSTIDHIIENLPWQLAERALDQFITPSEGDVNKVRVYLSCLGKRRWRLIAKKQSALLPFFQVPYPIEIITGKKDLDLVNHPVIVQLIKLKRERFGNRFTHYNIFFNLLFTILWTVATSIRVEDMDSVLTHDQAEKDVVLAVTVLAQLVTVLFIYKIYQEWKVHRRFELNEKRRKQVQCDYNKSFCHPRWVQELSLLMDRNEAAQKFENPFLSDGWTVIEITCLFLACVSTGITMVWYIDDKFTSRTDYIKNIRIFYSAAFVLIVWIRLSGCFKSHRTLGPFVAMLGECVRASCQIGFLFMEFFIPFAVAFWVTFGQKMVSDGTDDYYLFRNLLYQLWLIAFVGDYEFDTLVHIDHFLAQIFVGLYVLTVSIITINIYVALLSEGVARINGSALQRAYMEEALFINHVEHMFPELKREFEIYLNKYWAPKIMSKEEMKEKKVQGNTRTVVSAAAKTVIEVNKQLQSIIEGENDMKNTIEKLEDQLRNFSKHYDEVTSKGMVKEVTTVLDEQVHSVYARSITAARRTNARIHGILQNIKHRADDLFS